MLIGIDASRAAIVRRTGTEAYAYHLIRALLPLAQQRGHRLRLYYNQPPQSPIAPQTAAQIDSVVIPFPRLWTHLRLAAELHQRPPDLFFTPAHVIPISYFGKSVATVHDLGYHYFPEAHTAAQVRQLTWSTQHNARRSRVVLADSAATKQDLINFYRVSAEKIATVYPSFDLNLAPVSDSQHLQQVQHKLNLQAPYFLFLSTIQPRKNVARIVLAFAEIAAYIPHQLVLAGKLGWLSEQITATIVGLSAEIQARIKLTGFIEDADKAALLSGATALVYPSLFEGFGFPVLEAQACGTAVISADNSSIPEVAGNSARLVSAESIPQLAQAMRDVATDADYRQQLIKRGFTNIKRFSWHKAATQTLDILEQVYHA
ncbi:MAG: glycosyltransferase family 4 protein [Candidatus Promineifilaceae bacterium]